MFTFTVCVSTIPPLFPRGEFPDASAHRGSMSDGSHCARARMRQAHAHSRAQSCGGRRALVLHQSFRVRPVQKNDIGGEVRHGVTSGVSCETSKT